MPYRPFAIALCDPWRTTDLWGFAHGTRTSTAKTAKNAPRLLYQNITRLVARQLAARSIGRIGAGDNRSRIPNRAAVAYNRHNGFIFLEFTPHDSLSCDFTEPTALHRISTAAINDDCC